MPYVQVGACLAKEVSHEPIKSPSEGATNRLGGDEPIKGCVNQQNHNKMHLVISKIDVHCIIACWVLSGDWTRDVELYKATD